MLNPAGVPLGSNGVYPSICQHFCKEAVLFIDLLGDLLALLCEGECAIVLFYQAFLFRQFFDRPAHRRLFYIQKLRHIYAANIALLLLKHQHSL